MFDNRAITQAEKLVDDLVSGRIETAALSDMQIVSLNFDMEKAAGVLSENDLRKVRDKYEGYMRKRSKKPLDLAGYYERTLAMIKDFEQITPYSNLSEDQDKYSKLPGDEKKEESPAEKIFRAGVQFIESVAGYPSYWPSYKADRAGYLYLNGFVSVNLAAFAESGLVDREVLSRSLKMLDAYIQNDILGGNYAIEEFDQATAAVYSGALEYCREQQSGQIDVVMLTEFFATRILGITFEDEAQRNIFHKRELLLQYEILDGRSYRYLKL